MKRMAKLSLAAAVALCMMASLGAPSASADRFVAEVGLGELPTVEVHPVEDLRLKLASSPELKCTQYGWSGKFDEWRDPEVSAVPAYETLACTAESWWGESELETNGCNLVFSPGVLSQATLAIGPAGCGPMRLVTHGGFCEYSFAPQAIPLDPLAGEGTPATVPVAIEDTLAYTSESSMYCGSEAGAFLLQSEWELKARNETGSQVSLEVARDGIWFDPGSAQFKAEAYPDTFIGEPDASSPHSMKIGAGPPIKCQSARLKGAPVTAATSTIAVAPELSGCTVNLLGSPKPAKLSLNSCSYAIGAPSSGPPYTDAVDVACTKEGDSIGLKVYKDATEKETLCTYQIAAQSGLSSVELENLGSGDARAIDLTFKLGGIAVKRTQGNANVCGQEMSTATHSGGNTLYG
jgi:hypothetical protein